MRTGHVKRLPTIEQQNIVCAAWMEVNPQVCQPEQKITVTLPGGDVAISGTAAQRVMSGPARFVYEGEINFDV